MSKAYTSITVRDAYAAADEYDDLKATLDKLHGAMPSHVADRWRYEQILALVWSLARARKFIERMRRGTIYD